MSMRIATAEYKAAEPPSLSMHDLLQVWCGGTDPAFALIDAEISHEAQR
jgi:hypothetical protein